MYKHLVCLLAAALAAGGCKIEASQGRLHAHVLSRIGYGPDAWTRARIEALGVPGYVEEQLAPETIDDSALEDRLAAYPSLSMSMAELYLYYRDPDGLLGEAHRPRKELMSAKVLRATYSRRQLEAALLDFWFNHFNVNAASGVAKRGVVPYERDAIRPHVLGKFGDMLLAVAKHPAMLDYLDNARSFKDGFKLHGMTLGLNENFARELMELHTLGVDGPYDQTDVIEVARALTGWTVDYDWAGDGFAFLAAGHDDQPKTVLDDLEFPAGGGVEEGEAIVAYLAVHPKTAERLCGRLAARFVSESPPGGLVESCAATWRSTDGDLREVMRSLLHSPYFEGEGGAPPADFRAKAKRPLDFMASLFRATGTDLAFGGDLTVQTVWNKMGVWGEALYQTLDPTGLPEDSAAWAGAGPLLDRLNYMASFVQGAQLYGVLWNVSGGTSAEIVDALEAQLVLGGLGDGTRADLVAFTDALAGKPDAERVAYTAAMVLSAPEFGKK
ncbi:MAG: DUF1800 domain-containing protein [Candidatus Methylomirabilis sp.]|nr:DUF1800 domain-containing protein [Deltaproteobacteria bacterium]